MSTSSSCLISESMLLWINDQLREELERREFARVDREVPRAFWRLQAVRLATISLGGLGWLAVNLALGS